MLTNAFFKTRTDGKELENSSMIGRSSETEFTVSLWGFPSGLSQSYGQGIYTINGSFHNTNDPGGCFRIFILPGGGVKVYTGAGGVGGQLILGDADSPIQMNNWFHLMLVLENNTLNIFVNGQDKTSLATVTGTMSTMPSLLTSGYKNFMLGYWASTTYSWQGSMVHLATWDSDKSGDVSTIYNNGQPGDLTSLSPKNWWKLTDGSLVDSGSEADNAVAISTLPTVVATNVNSNSNTGISSGMTTANLVTSDLTRSIPYSSYSMEFDGTSDWIVLDNNTSLNGKTAFSFSVWVYPTATQQLYAGIIGYHTANDEAIKLHFGGTPANNQVTIGVFEPGNTAITTSSVDSVPLNTWTHIAVVGNASLSNVNLYINGTLDNDSVSGNMTSISQGSGFYIGTGSGATTSREFQGKISNASIWDTALSEDQIQTIYNGGVPNSISSLSPVSWWSLAGDSYYNGSDWICPDLGSGGNNGTSSGMGGTELVGDGPGSTANGIATSMDIPTNLKGEAPNSTSNAISINMTAVDRVTSVPG